MKILLATRRFFPRGDASSNIVGNLALSLQKIGCEVDIMAMTAYAKERGISRWNGIKVMHLYLPCSMDQNECKQGIQKGSREALVALCQKLIGKIVKRQKHYQQLSVEPFMVNTFRQGFKTMMRDTHYDLCLCTLWPIEAVYAAIQCCSSSTKLAVYQLDTYWNNVCMPEKWKAKRLLFEKTMVQKSAFVLTTPQIVAENNKYFDELSSRLICTEFPLIVKPQNDLIVAHDSQIHCVFLGTLYAELRPPEGVVQVISQLQTASVVFDFYGTGQELIRNAKAFEMASKRIQLHGAVLSSLSMKARDQADVLVNIDNTNPLQVPSKIFEYISTGKPIVNFYFREDSPTLLYLSQYPLCLNVLLNATQMSCQNLGHAYKWKNDEGLKDSLAKRGEKRSFTGGKAKLFDEFMQDEEKNPARFGVCRQPLDLFLQNVIGKRVPFKHIRALYQRNTPAYVATQCMEAYRNAMEREAISDESVQDTMEKK